MVSFIHTQPLFTDAALFLNGKKQMTPEVLERIQDCYIVAVDGGLKGCAQYLLVPDLIIGDLDSASKELLAKYPQVEKIQLDRTKDITDTEAAKVEVERRIENLRYIYLVNALGRRVDHTLSNILYVAREECRNKVRILGHQGELLFIVGPERNQVIENAQGKWLTFLPIFGDIEGLEINQNEIQITDFPTQWQSRDENVNISVRKGLILCLLTGQQEERESQKMIHGMNSGSVVEDFQRLAMCCHSSNKLWIDNEKELIFGVTAEQGKVKFSVQKGMTISLLPFFGSVEGVQTIGLYWPLNEATLDQNFFSISNIATADEVTVSVKKGFLLCVLNKTLIDEDMVEKLNEISL